MSSLLTRRTFMAGAVSALVSRARASEPSPPFRRGASIHNMMNWAAVEPNDKGRYQWPAFATPSHQLLPGLLPNLKQAGFDFIRLTLDTGVFLQFGGERRDELDQLLLVNIRRLLEVGFGVVVDFHPNWQVADYAPEKITASIDAQLFRSYGKMLARTARLLKPLAQERIALELMNEPQWGWDEPSTARWQQMQKIWHDQVRAEAPNLMLVLSGARGGDFEGLLQMDASHYGSSNVLWSFHYYKPFLLTHQGVKGEQESSRHWRYFSDLPYPAAAEHFEDAWRIVRRNIEEDSQINPTDRAALLAHTRKSLGEYLDMRPGRAMVAKDFDRIESWARKNNVPTSRIFLGEFGITRSYGHYRASPPQPLENYLADVRSEAEARNFGWAVWAATGYGGMALVRQDDRSDLDGPTLRGLGLTMR